MTADTLTKMQDLASRRRDAMEELRLLPDDEHTAEHRRYLKNKVADLTSQLSQLR